MSAAADMTVEEAHDAFLRNSYAQLRNAVKTNERPFSILPSVERILTTTKRLANESDLMRIGAQYSNTTGIGDAQTVSHILSDVVPALTGQSSSSRYYGFVTGGVLPVAEAADNVVSALDQNCGAHLPTASATGFVEDAALRMLLSLLRLGRGVDGMEWWEWPVRVLTTGATASNVLGLAAGRDWAVRQRLGAASRVGANDDLEGVESVGELGFLEACIRAGVRRIQVLTSGAHSSLFKAASIVGLGRSAVKELPYSEWQPWRLDIDAVERELQLEGVASIISVSAGEVNTGRFATTRYADMKRLRMLADKYKAWIHVDGGTSLESKDSLCDDLATLTHIPPSQAFGIFARALPIVDVASGAPNQYTLSQYAGLVKSAEGLELADSIAADGHKALNLPYDCGIFFSRHLQTQQDVFGNPNAAYLSSASSGGGNDKAVQQNPASITPSLLPYDMRDITSALNLGIENSRRFRALPLYAALVSHGRQGIVEMLQRMVDMARALTSWLREPAQREVFELLPEDEPGSEPSLEDVHMIVMFRARDPQLNDALVEKINASRDMYVTGTVWKGRKACRVAISNWRIQVERDMGVVTGILLRAVGR